MSEKNQIPVSFENVAGNEQTILKLIFSVSERAGNRNSAYSLAEDSAARIVIRGECHAAGLNDDNKLVICICNKDETPDGPSITRPLIATRVLSSLDRLVETFKILESGPEVSFSENDPVCDKESAHNLHETESVSDSSSLVEFSISEEEASQLAIVEDDSLSNPANMDNLKRNSSDLYSNEENAVEPISIKEETGEYEKVNASKTSGSYQSALVVDDSASVRKQLEIELELFEVDVDYAEDSDRAMDILSKRNYDVVFLDVVLPDGDGFEICKSIKAQQSTRKTKVIMLTGKASHADKVRGSLAGCDAYLIKPVGRATFQSTAKKYLKPVDNVEVMEA
ncbi:MAG: response regulator [Thiohalophilus sp.]|uniref:response regulator n=1 Tax=Thiohalophilus sp. TaxID=3028392 RepID=UPI0028701CC2|nr:response regulator [Thiohalophilus sp.]MDR9435235.1 response regulator [Thiohalophilus sp.]